MAGLLLVTATVNVAELSTLPTPIGLKQPSQPVFVLGDSLSVALEKGSDNCWPAQLARERHWAIENFAQAGATAKSALKQAKRLGDRPGVVLIEIGGNDLFSAVSSSQFERRLRKLLESVYRPDRTLVLIELPLPPFCNGYGRVQRSLAKDFDAVLISKRVLAGVLAGPRATTDGLHLSNTGHGRMAAALAARLEGTIVDVGGSR